MTIMYAGVLGRGGNDAVQFWDGSNIANKARLRTNSSNLIQSYGTLSFWFRFYSASVSTNSFIFNTADGAGVAGGLQVRLSRNGTLVFAVLTVGSSNVITVTSSTGFFNLDQWNNVIFEWDCTGTNKNVKIALNNNLAYNFTESNSNIFPTTNSLTLNGTPVDTSVQDTVSLYDLWYDLVNPDISLSATRQKFITVGGAPVNLGANGSLPFGSQPRLFLSGAFSQWKQNKGSAILLDTNSGQSGFFNPNTPDYFTKSPTKPT